MSAAAEPVAEKPRVNHPRPYVVLRKEGTSGWVTVRTIEALSAESAVRKAAEYLLATTEGGDLNETLVAVAETRFQPVQVKAEVQTRLKIAN